MENVEVKVPHFVLIDTQIAKTHIQERARPESLSGEEYIKRGIIHPGMKDADVLNAFRGLRTSILPKIEKFNSVVQVTAAHRGGGASFNALNLAVSCTFDKHRNALLVDCNFERPSLAGTLAVEPQFGLYDFLTGRTETVESIIYPTGIPRLSLVPAGEILSEDHVEFFTGEYMRIFLEDVRNRYRDRVIIIDAPPVLDSTDAKILAEVVDYSVVILPYKGASASKISKVIKAVGKDKIVGMVLNN